MGIVERIFKISILYLLNNLKSSSYKSFHDFEDYRQKFYHFYNKQKENYQNSNYGRNSGGGNYKKNINDKLNDHQKKIMQCYANLEIPRGSDIETVRKAWKMLLLKYHPDRHNNNDEKRKIATELTQKLNDSYFTIEKELKKSAH